MLIKLDVLETTYQTGMEIIPTTNQKKVDDGDDELREIIDGVEGLVSGCDGNG